MRRGKVCLGVFFIIGALIYIIIAVMEEALRAPMVVLAVIFLLFAFLLLRKKKEIPEVWMTSETSTPLVTIKTELTRPEVPQDILRDMRKYYKKMQAMDDMRIMRESFQLCQYTHDYEVFFSRLKLAERCALTLIQAKQARCRCGITPQVIKTCESVLQSSTALKIDFLERTQQVQIDGALKLKTPRGQCNRLRKYLQILEEHETGFMEVEELYNSVIEKVKDTIDEIEKAGEA